MSGGLRFLATALEDLADTVEEINRGNGWYDAERTVGDAIALLHSEVSEAFEAWRSHGFEDATDYAASSKTSLTPPKPEGYGSELADVLIRLVDQARRDGVNLAVEVERKLAYNRTRGYRHGGKRI